MKNKIKYSNKNVFVTSSVVIFMFFMMLFIFSSNYALTEFGNINLNCDKTSASAGEKVTCEVTGTINTAGSVSGIDSKILLSSNLEFDSFTVDNTEWIGDGDDMRLILYTEDNKSGDFNIGTLVVTVKEDTVNTVESISFTDTIFADANYEENIISDKSVSINTPTFSSTVYDLSKDYIVTTDNNVENILSNISANNDTFVVANVNGENVTSGIIAEDSSIKIIHSGNLIKSYDIVYFGSDVYDLNKDFIINTGKMENITSNIDSINAEFEIKENKLIVKYVDEVVREYEVFSISSNKYIISSSDNNIVIDSEVNDSIINNIMHSDNIDLVIEGNKLKLTSEAETLYSFDIITLVSDKYVIDLKDEYVFIKGSDINSNIISNFTTNGDLNLTNKTLALSYNSKEILDLKVVNVKMNEFKLDLEKNYIYTKNVTDEDKIISKFDTDCNVNVENGKINLLYGNDVLKQLNWYNFLTTYTISEDNILVKENVNYTDFVANFNFNGLNHKVYDLNSNEVTSGMIGNGYSLNVFVDETLVDTYKINVEYFDVNGLTLDEDNKIISGINIDDVYTNLLSKIETNGEVTIETKTGEAVATSEKVKTGDVIKVRLATRTIEYKVAVLGDVTGDGKINVGDVAKLYQYLKEKIDMAKEYQVAGDSNFDDTISVNDVSKLYAYLKERISTLN